MCWLKWRRARKSLRVSVLQFETQRREGRAGYGDTAGIVLGTVDGGGLLACLGSWLEVYRLLWEGLKKGRGGERGATR